MPEHHGVHARMRPERVADVTLVGGDFLGGGAVGEQAAFPINAPRVEVVRLGLRFGDGREIRVAQTGALIQRADALEVRRAAVRPVKPPGAVRRFEARLPRVRRQHDERGAVVGKLAARGVEQAETRGIPAVRERGGGHGDDGGGLVGGESHGLFARERGASVHIGEVPGHGIISGGTGHGGEQFRFFGGVNGGDFRAVPHGQRRGLGFERQPADDHGTERAARRVGAAGGFERGREGVVRLDTGDRVEDFKIEITLHRKGAAEAVLGFVFAQQILDQPDFQRHAHQPQRHCAPRRACAIRERADLFAILARRRACRGHAHERVGHGVAAAVRVARQAQREGGHALARFLRRAEHMGEGVIRQRHGHDA